MDASTYFLLTKPTGRTVRAIEEGIMKVSRRYHEGIMKVPWRCYEGITWPRFQCKPSIRAGAGRMESIRRGKRCSRRYLNVALVSRPDATTSAALGKVLDWSSRIKTDTHKLDYQTTRFLLLYNVSLWFETTKRKKKRQTKNETVPHVFQVLCARTRGCSSKGFGLGYDRVK